MYKFFVPHENITSSELPPLEVDGKFFRAGGKRVFIKAVTYGPFPDPQPNHAEEMAAIAKAGFNAIRIYDPPDLKILDAAHSARLWVMVGLLWQWDADFIKHPRHFSSAKVSLDQGLKKWGDHPAVAVVFMANEIPADMVRWMGVMKVCRAIEELIDLGQSLCPQLLFSYSNFPTTEYLEPNNASFTSFNVYLEDRERFASYLKRLHNIAGDRPVLISEFGVDTNHHNEEAQKEMLDWSLTECLSSGMAGITLFAWSDRWFNKAEIMDKWAFGLLDAEGRKKPALQSLEKRLPEINTPESGLSLKKHPMFSVIVCTYNGASRLADCLQALSHLDYPNYEVIVVDDGSTDETSNIAQSFKGVRFLPLNHGGLSEARNEGAKAARGEIIAYTDDDCEPDAGWLKWLAYAFQQEGWDACGGPNLPPPPPQRNHHIYEDEAVVASAPGAPTHVLLDDIKAEHLPGCNLVIKKNVLEKIGGFHAHYQVAGDDVDVCWRLHQQGYQMGFSGAAFVWHRRRTSLWKYFKQQRGYGKAEALLMRDHPKKFTRSSGAKWLGRIYAGGPMHVDAGSLIYHGEMGLAPYQQIALTTQPQRPLPLGYRYTKAKLKLQLTQHLQPWVRAFYRWFFSLKWRKYLEKNKQPQVKKQTTTLFNAPITEATWWSEKFVMREEVLSALRNAGWKIWHDKIQAHPDDVWDLYLEGCRLLVASESYNKRFLIHLRVQKKTQTSSLQTPNLENIMSSLGFQKKG